MTMPLGHAMVSTNKTTPHCMARALYDNLAESPDELAFRRGDTLTVLEQNTGGSEGWWLCTLRGRQGICPGNRLRLLAGVYDTGGGPLSPPLTPTPPQPPAVSTNQSHARRRSWKFQPTKVVLPQRVGDVYLYEQPQSLCSVSPGPFQSQTLLAQAGQNFELYDVPRPAVPVNYDTPRNWSRGSPINKDMANDWYDVPRNPVPVLLHQQQLTPSSSASSLTIDSMSSSNRSSLATMPEYDVPKSRGGLHSHQSCDIQSSALTKELPLEWSKALEMLERLQCEATGAITKLLGYVRPGWRSHSALSPEILDIRLAAIRLRAALHDFAEFTEGCLGNAASANDKGLAIKLRPLVKALRDADRLVNEINTNLDAINWAIDQLSKPDEVDDVTLSNITPDALDQLIACARTLTEDIRQTTSFIQGNSTLLFKKGNNCKLLSNTGEWIEEYDYVKLESRDSVNKKYSEISKDLPHDLKKNFDRVIKDGDNGTANIKSKPYNLAPDEKQLITFYAVQTITYFKYLTNSIDAFLQTVEKNQPPKIFLAHGKFVVLNAHRLVYIGDTVYKNIVNKELKDKILKSSNALSDGLSATVVNAKNAGLQYPSVAAVQSMVDSVADVSHFARDLKQCMILGASQP